MAFRSSSRIPVWLFHALACLAWWGLWGFLAKVGSDEVTALQLQILFSLGMLPIALFALAKLRFRLTTKRLGATYGILNGLLTGLGLLAYYVAMSRGKASIVGPVTALFPLITILLAFVILRERLNRIQGAGIVLAICAVALLSI